MWEFVPLSVSNFQLICHSIASQQFNLTRALLFSGFLLDLIFYLLVFINGNTYIFARNVTKRDYEGFFYVFNWKENKEVGTICFELGIQKKKTHKKVLGFNNSILEGTQTYLWKRFYSIKTPLGNRAKSWAWFGLLVWV